MSSPDRPGRGSRTCAFDPKGRIVALTGPDGGTTRFAYDGDRRVVQVQDPDGRLHEASWEAGRVLVAMRAVTADGAPDASASAESGRTCSFDAAARLVALTGADRRVTAIEYDSERHEIRIHDPGPVHKVSWHPGRTVTEAFGARCVDFDPTSAAAATYVGTRCRDHRDSLPDISNHVGTYTYHASGRVRRIGDGDAIETETS